MTQMQMAFEQMCWERGLQTRKRVDGSYHMGTTHQAWVWWQKAYEAGQRDPVVKKNLKA